MYIGFEEHDLQSCNIFIWVLFHLTDDKSDVTTMKRI